MATVSDKVKEALAKIAAAVKANPAGTVADIARATGVPDVFVNNVLRRAKERAAAQAKARMSLPASAVPVADETPMLVTDGSGFFEPPTKYSDDPEFYTDFDQLISDHAASSVNDDGSSASDLQRLVAVRDRYESFADKASIDSKGAPLVQLVNTNPPTIRKAILGNQAIVTTGGISSALAFWNGDEDETRAVTVTGMNLGEGSLSGVQTTYPAANVPGGGPYQAYFYSPYIRVQFGTRGTLNSVEVDIGRGCQFTVFGAGVTVQAGMDLPPLPSTLNNLTYATTGSMLLGATMSFGPKASVASLTRTKYFGPATASGPPAFSFSQLTLPAVSTMTIPNYATEILSVYTEQDYPYYLLISDFAGVVLKYLNVPLGGNVAPIALPANARWVQIYNPDGALTINGSVVFGIEL